MTPERFWKLVATLEGRVDDARAEALEDRLGAGEAEAFADHVQQRVDALLERCDVPASHSGDAAEWLAAAVVAAGAETYHRTLAESTPLDPSSWDWEEAEALLVVGHHELDPGQEQDDSHWRDDTPDLPLTFQWQAEQVPRDVRTMWGLTAEAVRELGVAFDPAFGQVPAIDPHFTEVVAERPAATLERHLIVSDDVAEPQWLLFPEGGAPEHLVLVVPPGPLLEQQDRRPIYRELLAAFDAALADVSED